MVTIKDNVESTMRDMAESFPVIYTRALKSLGAYFRNKEIRQFRQGNVGGVPFAPLAPMTLAIRNLKIHQVRKIRKSILSKAEEQNLDTKSVKRSKVWKRTTQRLIELRTRKLGDLYLPGGIREGIYEAGTFGGKIPRLARYVTSPDGSTANPLVRFGFLGDVIPKSDKRAQTYQEHKARSWSKGERHGFHKMFGKRFGNLVVDSYSRPEREAVAPLLPEVEQEADRVLAKATAKLTSYYSTRGGWR